MNSEMLLHKCFEAFLTCTTSDWFIEKLGVLCSILLIHFDFFRCKQQQTKNLNHRKSWNLPQVWHWIRFWRFLTVCCVCNILAVGWLYGTMGDLRRHQVFVGGDWNRTSTRLYTPNFTRLCTRALMIIMIIIIIMISLTAPPSPSTSASSSTSLLSSRRSQMFTVDSSLGTCRNQIEPTSACCLVLKNLATMADPSDMTTPCRYESAVRVCVQVCVCVCTTTGKMMRLPVCAKEH